MAKLTQTEISEIERLASMLATARVIRARFNAGTYAVEGSTAESVTKRVENAESALRAYLEGLE